MGKTIDDNLDYYELVYRNKYKMAKGLIPDPNNTLSLESQLENFTDLEAYKAYIIEKFELGEGFYNSALQLSEVVRKRVLKDEEINDLDKAISRLSLINDMTKEVTVHEVHGVFNQIMNL